MSDQSDSQNKEEEQIHMSEGTSPSSSSDEGSRSTPSNFPKAASKAKSAPKRNTRSIPAAEKNKAPVPEVAAEEDDEGQVPRKLKPKIPDHNDAHPVAENMKLRKDAGLRQWRLSDPYAIIRRTDVDYRFHTKE